MKKSGPYLKNSTRYKFVIFYPKFCSPDQNMAKFQANPSSTKACLLSSWFEGMCNTF